MKFVTHLYLTSTGKHLDQYNIETLLSECLLTDYEFCLGPSEWKSFEVSLRGFSV